MLWQCARCDRIMRNSGVHRPARTSSGHRRLVNLCPPCAEWTDRERWKRLVQTALGVTGGAAAAVYLAYLCGALS